MIRGPELGQDAAPKGLGLAASEMSEAWWGWRVAFFADQTRPRSTRTDQEGAGIQEYYSWRREA